MSDSSFIVFHSPASKEVSPVVYLHWFGGLTISILEGAMPRMRTGDAGYSCARFIGRCHEGIEGNTGLGVNNIIPVFGKSTNAPTSNSKYKGLMIAAKRIQEPGRGVFIVNVDEWTVEHAGSCSNAYGDAGDGFGMQENTKLKSKTGILKLPAKLAPR